MIIEEWMPLMLADLFDDRVYADETPDTGLQMDSEGLFLPFVIYQHQGGVQEEYVDQTLPEMENTRLQIHVVGRRSIEADDLMRQVRQRLMASEYTVGVLGSPVSTTDSSRKLRGRMQHFSVWYKP